MGYLELNGSSERKNVASRLLALVMTIILVLSTCMLVKPTSAYAADDDSVNNSFFTVAAAATNYMDIMLSYNKDNAASGITSGLTVGNMAGAMGVVDSDYGSYISDNITRFEKQAANVYKTSYISADAFTKANSENKMATVRSAEYGYYGYALNYLGLDETAPEQTTDVFRMISGSILQGVWTVSGAVDGVMAWCVHMLQVFNPFQFFQNAVIDVNGNTNFTMGATHSGDSVTGNADYGSAGANAGGSTSGAFSEVTKTISNIYMFVQNLSWAVILPLFLCLALFMFAVGRLVNQQMAAKGSSNLRRWFVRVLFIVVAIPLLGGIYTPTLNAIAKAYSDSAGDRAATISADAIVVSQLVDFESWAEQSSLSSDIFVKSDGSASPLKVSVSSGGVPDGSNISHVRDYATTINSKYGGINVDYAKSVESTYTKNVETSVLGVKTNNGQTIVTEAHDKSLTDKVSGLIQRYTQGSRYTSASFVTFANQELLSVDQNSFNAAVLTEWVKIVSKTENYGQGLTSVVKNATTEVIASNYLNENGSGTIEYGQINSSGGKAELGETLSDIFNKYMSGEIDQAKRDELLQKLIDVEQEATNAANGVNPTEDYDYSPILWLTDGGLTADVSGDTITYKQDGTLGLSTIGMYNYLNTVFASDGMYIYSTPVTQNLPSMSSHYAVSSVGSSLYGALLMANSIALLAAFAIIGLVYGLGMLFSNLKRSIQLIISIPFAMIGVMQSMARVFMLVLMMLVEILVMFFLYKIICQILMFVNDIITTGVQGVLESVTGSSGGGTPSLLATIGIPQATAATSDFGVEAMNCLALLIAIVLLLIFIIFALKIRKSISNMCNELIGKVAEKFFESNGGADAKSHMGSRMASGAMLGATMLARNGGMGKMAAAAAGAPLIGAGVAAMYGASKAGGTTDVQNQNSGAAELTGNTDGAQASQVKSGDVAGFDRQTSGRGGSQLSGAVSGDLNGNVDGMNSSAMAEANSDAQGGEGKGFGNDAMKQVGFSMAGAEGADAYASAAGGADSMYGAEGGRSSSLSSADVDAYNQALGGDGAAGMSTASADAEGYGQGVGGAVHATQAAYATGGDASASGRGEGGYGTSEAQAMGLGGLGYGSAEGGDVASASNLTASSVAEGGDSSAEGRADSLYGVSGNSLSGDAYAEAESSDGYGSGTKDVALGDSVSAGDVNAQAGDTNSEFNASLSPDSVHDSSKSETRAAQAQPGQGGAGGAAGEAAPGGAGGIESSRSSESSDTRGVGGAATRAGARAQYRNRASGGASMGREDFNSSVSAGSFGSVPVAPSSVESAPQGGTMGGRPGFQQASKSLNRSSIVGSTRNQVNSAPNLEDSIAAARAHQRQLQMEKASRGVVV